MSQLQHAPARSNKIKAVLAGGLVLGVGASVTLASWTDQAYVDATFGTSAFNIQVRTDGGTAWAEAATAADASMLAFELPLADDLQPGDTVYAPLDLQTTAESVAGTVTLQPATLAAGSQDLFNVLTYTVVETADCSAAGVAASTSAIIPAGSGLDTVSVPGAITLGAASADPAELCFAVSLAPDANDPSLQGLSASALWRLAATSVD